MLVTACLVLIAQCAFGQDHHQIAAVKDILIEQVASWNAGDIDGYMRGYWESDSTMFSSGGELTMGFRKVLARYKKNYSNREKMGTLEFRDLALQPLSPTIIVATGIWQLKRKQDNPWGRFTLIFERKPEGWRITHDHTSEAGK